jgi:hypothetical protein
MNNREFVSRVLNGLKSLSKDSMISRRFILKVGQEKAKFFISQKAGENSIYREDNLLSSLNCFELKKIDIIDCPIIEFRTCKQLMQSKKKLPELIYSKFGSSIKEVTSLDGEHLIKPITLAQYRLNKQRKDASKDLYFYIKDNYLYIPDTEVEIVNVSLITLDLFDLDELSSCKESNCKSAWDYDFICSDKLMEVVISETIKEVVLSKQVQEDQNPNLNEGS